MDSELGFELNVAGRTVPTQVESKVSGCFCKQFQSRFGTGYQLRETKTNVDLGVIDIASADTVVDLIDQS